MKKVLAREALWLLFAIIVAFPLAFVFLWMLDLSAQGRGYTDAEKNFIAELYLIGYVISFVGIYVLRIIAALIRAAVS
jgi:hypothetical protein